MLKTILDDSPLLVETLDKVSRQNFSIIPHNVIRDLRLSPFSVRLYGAIDARQGQKDSQAVYRKLIASDLGVSVRTVSRGIKELTKYGYLDVQLRGWASRYYLKNDSRIRKPRQKEQGVMTNMAPPQINNSYINNQNSGDDVGEDNFEKIVLKVINAETKVYLQQNPKTKALCLKAHRLGEDPHFYAKKVSKHFLEEKKKRLIYKDAGFIVSVCMKAILEGDETITQEVATPIPAKYDSNEVLDLCTIHADFGALKNACPLCRKEKENKGLVNELLKPNKPLQEEKFSQLTEGLFKVDK